MVRLTDLQKVVVVGLLQLCTVKTIITFNFLQKMYSSLDPVCDDFGQKWTTAVICIFRVGLHMRFETAFS